MVAHIGKQIRRFWVRFKMKCEVVVEVLNEVKGGNDISATPTANDSPLKPPSGGFKELGNDGGHGYLTLYCACGETFPVPIRCGDRLCPICTRSRAMRYADKIAHKVEFLRRTGKHARFLTLTCPYYPTLDEAYKVAKDSFAKLRRHKDWKQYVNGGAATFEITNNKDGWRVHIHAIIEGGYYPQKKVSQAWEKATGNAFVVDIRLIKGNSMKSVKELCKYPFKPANVSTWTYQQKEDFRTIMNGKRLLSTFGTWFGESMISKYKMVCPFCGSDQIAPAFDIDYLLEEFSKSWDPINEVIPAHALEKYGMVIE